MTPELQFNIDNKCLVCGGQIAGGYCEDCGARIGTKPIDPRTEEDIKEEQKEIIKEAIKKGKCFTCGKSISPKTVYCDNCGLQIREPDKSQKSKESKIIIPQLPIITPVPQIIKNQERGMNKLERKKELVDWQNFYRDVFGIEVDLSNLHIPEKQEGFKRLIIMAQGIMPQLAYDKCEELFPCWKSSDESLDEIINFSFQARSTRNGSYAIWIRDRIEADEELKNISADDIESLNIPTLTLEERFIYELKYFKKTRKHLDIKNITLCSGSRYSDGYVPRVSCWHGRMDVDWGCSGSKPSFYGDLRARKVVS